ncbi:DUF4136 domain-containing protein [Sediminibacterium ginsengisoli]|uniref:DUF4136 domain-containing protein n=1 Tax=Sediminibacterium ginsengisoli TaxID=413434 RepID=A0A1T4JU86_9BACT|nr:DUF4136 domain-containing protein [Sediminibacterium ginsengisoli]SJZ33698.1 protein of unknown function [Sediminibacterium ginsengisoli]
MKKIVSICFAAVFLLACSGIKVFNTESAENVNPADYKTFGFYELKASGDTITRGFPSRVNILQTAIQEELTARGYTRNDQHPDLLVNIGIVIKQEIQTRQTDWQTDGRVAYIGQRNYSWKSTEVEVGRYREGTVTIHLVDARQQKMIWKGSARGVLPDKAEVATKTVRKGMHQLFAKYPYRAS